MADQDGRVPGTRDLDRGELPRGPGECKTALTEVRWQAARARRIRRLANASLILAVISCPLLLLAVLYTLYLLHQWGLPFVGRLIPHLHPVVLLFGFAVLALIVSPVAIVAGHMAIARGRSVPGTGRLPWRAVIGTTIGYLNIIVPITLVAFAYFNKGRPNADMAACQGNLRQMQTEFREYREANPGTFPPLSSQRGVLMFTPEAIRPGSFSRGLPFTCPTYRYAGLFSRHQASDNPASAYDDQSYFYLGYAVFNDDDVEAFAKAYRKRIAEGGTFDEDLVVEDGNRTRVLHRLSDEVLAQHWMAHQEHDLPSVPRIEVFAPSLTGNQVVAYHTVGVAPTDDIPLLIERDRGHVYTDWGPPAPRGANVLYAYHGVLFIERGTWPMTEKTQRILAELAE